MQTSLTLPVPAMRFVLVHYHIFKNGGSTIESILEREFEHRYCTLHGACPEATLDGAQLAAFLADHPAISAISSHHLRYPKPAIPNTALFDCCFLRHPLDRLESMYRYFRELASANVASLDPLSRRAARCTAGEFLERLLQDAPHLVSDIQVTQLGNSGAFTRPMASPDLERAKAAVLDMSIPGLVDRFDQSLVPAEYFLQAAFPGISLQYVARNVTCLDSTPFAERETRWRREWGSRTYDRLARLNQLDLELYRFTSQEIERRYSLVPDAESRLAHFRVRCGRLQTTAAAGD